MQIICRQTCNADEGRSKIYLRLTEKETMENLGKSVIVFEKFQKVVVESSLFLIRDGVT
jgi:hypothetical protein